MTHTLPNLIDARTLLDFARAPVVLDATLSLDPTQPSGAQRYRECHIQGAHYFDLNEVRDTKSTLPRMLPPFAQLQARIRGMGIGETQPVVVYDQDGLYSAPRVWWMLRCLGHGPVAVLDGGLNAWTKAGGSVESGPSTRWPEGVEEASAPPSSLSRLLGYTKQRIVDLEGVQKALQDPECAVLDARSRARFLGQAPERASHLRSGHMPGSFSLPYAELVTEDGCLVSKEELLERLDALKLARPPQRWVSSCGSGVTACIFALAMEHHCDQVVRVYDGSWSEWGAGDATEVQR